jgi:hypothetical protein
MGRRGALRHRGAGQDVVIGELIMDTHTGERGSLRRRSGYEGLRDDLVGAHPEHARFLGDRWYYHLTMSQRAACRARNWVYASRFFSVAGLALLPAIVTLQSSHPQSLSLQVLAIVTSVLVALSGGILSIARVHERWRLNHGLQEKLGRAGWNLIHRPASFALFHETVERDLAAADLVYQSSVTAVSMPVHDPGASGSSSGARSANLSPVTA